MNTTHLEKELLRYTKGLSKEALQEVIDFVQFLRKKKSKKTSNNLTEELTKLGESQTSHLEEEFANYKKLYPSE